MSRSQLPSCTFPVWSWRRPNHTVKYLLTSPFWLWQTKYLPGQRVNVFKAELELARLRKLPLDKCNTSAQRSLLVLREQLRTESAADKEVFEMVLFDGRRFEASRTYPFVEVDIVQTIPEQKLVATLVSRKSDLYSEVSEA